jgi:hypothetical protein
MPGIHVKSLYLGFILALTVSIVLPSHRILLAGTPATQTLRIVTEDYEFRGPDRIDAGLTTIEIHNHGKSLHHVQLVRMPPDKTIADFQTALKNNPPALPVWLEYVGGPNAVVPGETASATVHLEGGDYLLLCLIPNEKGVPHLALGMLKPILVEGSSVKEVRQMVPALSITLVDFAFGVSQAIQSGPQTIHVTNKGALPHEVVVVRLAEDASIQDFAKFAEHQSGPPPGKPVGGMVGLSRGSDGSFTTAFEPGRYGLICFFPDAENGAPHFTRGMMSEFTVK